PSNSVATTSSFPSSESLMSDGGFLNSATQMKPSLSTARPFGSPVRATMRLDDPSGVICVTQPRPAPPSTTSQLPSGSATGPSGTLRPLVKMLRAGTAVEMVLLIADYSASSTALWTSPGRSVMSAKILGPSHMLYSVANCG